MDWQQALVFVVVILSAAYLVRRSWRTWFVGKAGCGSECDCSAKNGGAGTGTEQRATYIPLESLTLRKRD